MAPKTQRTSKAAAKKQILIVDDHPMMRQGLSQLLKSEGDLAVCGEAETSRQALDQAIRLKPDLVLIDITLPDKNGLELIKDIHAVLPETLLLVISMHDESMYAERVLRAGGRGYIMKQEGGKRLMEAIRQVLSGQIYVSPKMSAKILEGLSGRKAASGNSPVDTLTDREFEVFQLIGQGTSTRLIAEQLHLSTKTVEVHRVNIKQKLNMKTAPDLIRFAVRWIESEPSSQM
jgi:DNA-binding NarL/FixJ family response regulator